MSTNAKLCDSCKSGKCILCGSSFAKNMAYLCNSCGIGSKGNQCVKCGRSFARNQAYLCQSCAIKYRNKCIKCGRMV